MTFSYNLVLALFLLAPGFAVYAGLFVTTQRDGRLHSAPPAPNSILTLALVTLSALALHGVWASLLSGQSLYAAHFQTFQLPFDPNIYVDLLNAGRPCTAAAPCAPVTGWEVTGALWSLTVLSLGGYFATAWLLQTRPIERRLRGLLYGWASEIVDVIQDAKPGRVPFINAFVLTNTEHEGTAFGYEGALRNMALNADKEIISIALSDVTAFYVNLKMGEFKRVVLPATAGIPNIYLEKAQIRNVAFNFVEFIVDDEAPPEPAST